MCGVGYHFEQGMPVRVGQGLEWVHVGLDQSPGRCWVAHMHMREPVLGTRKGE
jgi:hypothetical protein